jgi:hypothetical protein
MTLELSEPEESRLTKCKLQMVVVPKEDQMRYVVAEQFFELTLGRLGQPGLGSRIFNAFIAVGCLFSPLPCFLVPLASLFSPSSPSYLLCFFLNAILSSS